MRLSRIETMQLKSNLALLDSHRSLEAKSEKSDAGYHKKQRLLSMPSVLLVCLILTSSVQAQFIVTPMQFEIDDLGQGRQVRRVLALENRDKLESHQVYLEAVELYQSKQGDWSSLEPNELASAADELNLATHASCREWITLRQSSVVVPAYDKVYVPFLVRAPGGVRGFFCAGIRVRLEPRDGVSGVVIRYDFVVPILVTMQGPTLRSEVELSDAGLVFIETNSQTPATTMVTLGIQNKGMSFSKITPKAAIWQVLESGKTRLIKREVSFGRLGIIPGAELNLALDLGARLPSGEYRIVGNLEVDNRRVKDIKRDVNFVNPTGRGIVHEDAAMRVDPPVLEIEMSPGRSRSGLVSLFNSAQEDIVIKAVTEVPRVLAQKAAHGGLIRGEELSCADWIEIRPTEIPVRGERGRNIRLIAKMPETSELTRLNTQPSHYYATIRFYGFYRDGTSAGVETALVSIVDTKVDPEYIVEGQSLKINPLGASKFNIMSSFRNQSLAHIMPKCTANISVQTAQGLNTGLLMSERLENLNAPSLMMPLESRDFAKEFDFSKVPEGNYRVEARLSYLDEEGNGLSQDIQKLIQVYTRPGEDERRVQVIGTSEVSANNIGG